MNLFLELYFNQVSFISYQSRYPSCSIIMIFAEVGSTLYNRDVIKSVTQSLKKLRTAATLRKSPASKTTRTARAKTLTNREAEQQQQITQVPEQVTPQQQLQQFGFAPDFSHNLFKLRCEDSAIKAASANYTMFVASLLKKINHKKGTLIVSDLNFKDKSLDYLIKCLAKSKGIKGVDFSNQRVRNIESVCELLKHTNENQIYTLICRNMNLQTNQLSTLVDAVLTSEHIIHFDISNHNSDALNRLSDNFLLLERLISQNKTIMFLELQGLNIRDRGVESLKKACVTSSDNPLLSLNLKNNNLTSKSYNLVRRILEKSSIMELKLGDNPLTDEHLEQLAQTQHCELLKLDLSNCSLTSMGLITVLRKVCNNNKQLTTLVLDKNNFSDSWFAKIDDVLAENKSLKELHMVECRIKNLEYLFDGLGDNFFMESLNISCNLFDPEREWDYLKNSLIRNNTLKHLKMRFCRINPQGGKAVADALEFNKSIQTIDISQNNIGPEIGKYLLSCVNRNMKLTEVCLEKTQIEVVTRKFIEEKMRINRTENIKTRHEQLKKESNLVKYKDKQIRDNLDTLKLNVAQNSSRIKDLKGVVESVGIKQQEAKKKYQDMVADFEGTLSSMNKQLIRIQGDAKPILKELEHALALIDSKLTQAQAKKQAELSYIDRLQKQLEAERKRIRVLENKLQDEWENQKYRRKNRQSISVSLPRLEPVKQSPLKRKASRVVENKTASKVELKLK